MACGAEPARAGGAGVVGEADAKGVPVLLDHRFEGHGAFHLPGGADDVEGGGLPAAEGPRRLDPLDPARAGWVPHRHHHGFALHDDLTELAAVDLAVAG